MLSVGGRKWLRKKLGMQILEPGVSAPSSTVGTASKPSIPSGIAAWVKSTPAPPKSGMCHPHRHSLHFLNLEHTDACCVVVMAALNSGCVHGRGRAT
jgi:hypothetical protein